MKPLLKVALISILTCGTLLTFTACSTTSINDYKNNTPKLLPEKFFQGDLTAHGVVKNRSGKVIRYFNADIKAHWENNIGTLDEKFTFNDGEVQSRVWKLNPVKSADGVSRYTATAGDVIGDAQGITAGNAFNLHYVLAVKYEGDTINVSVNDWMWLVNEKTILNESILTKFGFKVGSIQLTIIKRD
nr:Protein of unknown function (DUF3833) [uncultured bacterium]